MMNMEINPIIRKILYNRGIASEEDIAEFLTDKPKKTYDPFLLPDMEAGVDLILSAAEAGADICVYGDYDADGVTATALMLTVLAHLTERERLSYYIPSRFEEGYGLNMQAVRAIAERGCDLLITVDCGSVSAAEVAYAKELGLEVLVTDHHNITDVMADCLLINPKRPDSRYPFRELAGCGVAFKVAQALQKTAGLPKSVLTEVLDLAAIGTVGDVMPLIDENRTITKFGLRVLNSGQRRGLAILAEGASLKPGSISAGNISFVIVPHLNACGRLGDATQAVELLLGEKDEEQLAALAGSLLEKNRLRRSLQDETYSRCLEKIEADALPPVLLIDAGSAHEGITGIVAGKIKERFYRPTLIVTAAHEGEDFLKGTGRSIEGVDLYSLIKTQESLLEKFGGHAGACGFLLRKENYPAFRAGLLAAMEELCAAEPELLIPKRHVDMRLDQSELTPELGRQLSLLAPFGTGNSKPLFELHASAIGELYYMGDNRQHVRFTARSLKSGAAVQCVMFGRGHDAPFSAEQARRPAQKIFGSLEVQQWQGNDRLQFMVSEIKFADSGAAL